MLDSIFNLYSSGRTIMNKHGSGIGWLCEIFNRTSWRTITVSSKVNEGSTFTFTLPNKRTDNTINNNFETSKSERIDFEFSDIKK